MSKKSFGILLVVMMLVIGGACAEEDVSIVLRAPETPQATQSAQDDPDRLAQPVYQFDYPDTLVTYGGEDRSIATSGGAAVVLSMALEAMGVTEPHDPATLFMWAVDNHKYHGNGLGLYTITDLAKEFGFRWKWAEMDRTDIVDTLEAGHPIIAYVAQNHFSEAYVLLVGLNDEGRLLVNDPNSKPKTEEQSYRSRQIIHWLGRPDGFLICK